MVTGALCQILVENVEKLEITDPHWRHLTAKWANKLKEQLDKELNQLLGNPDADKQFWLAAKLYEDDTKESYEHIVKEITRVVLGENESNKSKEVQEEV
jgi:hypothetical protein